MNGLLLNNKRLRKLLIAGLAVFVFFSVLSFNVAHLTKRLTFDCMSYSKSIEKGTLAEIYHAHHILYNTFKWELYTKLQAEGYEGRALLVGQVFNSFCGALGVALIFLLIVFLTKDIFVGLLMSALTAMSFGWWYCSVFNGVRIFGVAALTAVFLLLCYFLYSEEKRFNRNLLLVAGAALLHALAVFLHQTHVMFLAVVFTGMLFKKDTWLKKAVYFSVYCGVFWLTVISGYLYVGFSVFHFNSLIL